MACGAHATGTFCAVYRKSANGWWVGQRGAQGDEPATDAGICRKAFFEASGALLDG